MGDSGVIELVIRGSFHCLVMIVSIDTVEIRERHSLPLCTDEHFSEDKLEEKTKMKSMNELVQGSAYRS